MNKDYTEYLESMPSVYDSLWTNNKDNLLDYSVRSSSNPRSIDQKNKDRIFDKIQNTNWESESKYHNTYHGKPIGNAIKMKNKEWHKLTKNKYAKGI